jgi:predicted ATPase/DNA-binding SARP family transcriptional activator
VYDIRVLGPVQVVRDGEPVAVPGGKTAELLVRLALDAGAWVDADRLRDDLWSGEPISRNTLQQKVARLRRALGEPSLVQSGDAGYRLAVAPEAVDARRLLRGEGASEHLDGHLLPAAGDWAATYRTQLEAARLKLAEEGLAGRVRAGEDVVVELEAAVAELPYQEGLWELLITALYRAGRQADALAAYHRVRARLDEDLGLEPGPRLKDLERQVLSQDARLRVAAGNLPALAAALVGREADERHVSELLASGHLVEIVGTGGIGKTALAIAVGRAQRDPAWFVRLETARTAKDVLDAVLGALEVVGGEGSLRERLRRGPALVILDNCEHVAAQAAALVERLLADAPAVRVLCTSQVSLGLPGSTVVELAPLALDDAVALFTLRASRPGEPGAIRDLCRSLDGLPLAIELAAARTRTLSVADISRRLDDRFAILNDPASHQPERRRALKATIGWSYELLFPDDQRGLWALGTFAGGASLAALESVLGALDVPGQAAIDVLARLAGRSLVIVDDPPRYRLLESIRDYALDALAQAGAVDRARDAHAAWYVEQAASSTAGVRSAAQAQHLAFARVERANIDAALAWCIDHDPPRALALAAGFGWAWIVLGDARGADRLRVALDAVGEHAPPRDRAAALLLLGWSEASSGHLEPARRHVVAATQLVPGDPELQARCAYHLAYVVSHHGDWDHALELTAGAQATYRGLDLPWDQAANALFASRAAISAGEVARARAARDEVLRCVAAVDDPWLQVRCEAMLGELARVEQRFDDAVTHIARAAETSGRLGFAQTEAYQLTSLGRAQCQAGDYAAGSVTLELGIAKAQATGDVRMVALGRVHLGRILRALGRTEDARAALEAAAAFHREAGGGEQAALGDCLLAAMDMPATSDRLEQILDAARREGDAPVEVFALDALGRSDEADERMPVAAHFITERDRVDRRAG